MKKRIIFIALLILVLIGLNSCKQHISGITNYKEIEAIMNEYIGNYKERDTILFVDEQNQIDTLAVGTRECNHAKFYTGIGFGEKADIEISFVFCLLQLTDINYDSVVAELLLRQNYESRSFVYFHLENDYYKDAKKRTGGTNFVTNWIDINDLTDENYTVNNTLGQSCVLSKGKGITRFEDETGHVWTLLEK